MIAVEIARESGLWADLYAVGGALVAAWIVFVVKTVRGGR